MKIAMVTVVSALLLGSAMAAVSQAPQVDRGKQYAITVSKMDAPLQAYEKNCNFFYWSEIFGKGSEMVGFSFAHDGKTEHSVGFVKNLSFMIDEGVASPTAQMVSAEDSGHYVLRLNRHNYEVEQKCLVGVAQTK
jgi:hypothetical protein